MIDPLYPQFAYQPIKSLDFTALNAAQRALSFLNMIEAQGVQASDLTPL